MAEDGRRFPYFFKPKERKPRNTATQVAGGWEGAGYDKVPEHASIAVFVGRKDRYLKNLRWKK